MKIKRCIISVSNKDGLESFARELHNLGIEIISTGGTSKFLEENAIPVKHVENVTKFPHILGGRVKTLHPVIFGGILALRKNPLHAKEMHQYQIQEIDMVVCNLYPFEATVAKPDVTIEDALENIDIGGVTLIRAAAKNFQDVVIVIDQNDYPKVLEQIRSIKDVPLNMRLELARKAYRATSSYDSAIHRFLDERQI